MLHLTLLKVLENTGYLLPHLNTNVLLQLLYRLPDPVLTVMVRFTGIVNVILTFAYFHFTFCLIHKDVY